ncbi:MAG: exo-alpha-sialidase [Planctomycetales bacterium]|nr:exo-alpha-sialidase [Planctomycetales bacterium]
MIHTSLRQVFLTFCCNCLLWVGMPYGWACAQAPEAPNASSSAPQASQPYVLWTGLPISNDAEQIPFVEKMHHRTIHQAAADGYRFLHGAAIVEHQGAFYASWANSPNDENGPHETLQCRRSLDNGKTWSDLQIIGPGFEGPERHSHGILLSHQGELWSIGARFGIGAPGRKFSGLCAEAFVLDEDDDQWRSRGIAMQNCWPYDQPVRMEDGNWITGGQDKDGLPVVAVSHGDDVSRWRTISIPYPQRLEPAFAETTVWADADQVLAVIRGGGGVAWVSLSNDCGQTWSLATESNFPMPRAKAYLARLSNGQLYLLSNFKNRDTLVISAGRPGDRTLSRMWRIRHGKSPAPRFPGFAKSKQWSYPYGYEHDGKLYVVYSIGKEDCGMSILDIDSLKVD